MMLCFMTGQRAIVDLDHPKPYFPPPPKPKRFWLSLGLKEGLKNAVEGIGLPASLNVFYLN